MSCVVSFSAVRYGTDWKSLVRRARLFTRFGAFKFHSSLETVSRAFRGGGAQDATGSPTSRAVLQCRSTVHLARASCQSEPLRTGRWKREPPLCT